MGKTLLNVTRVAKRSKLSMNFLPNWIFKQRIGSTVILLPSNCSREHITSHYLITLPPLLNLPLCLNCPGEHISRYAWTIDITYWTQAHNNRCLHAGAYVPCIYGMPGGVIVDDSGLCCCGPAFNVWRQLFERDYFPLFVDSIEWPHSASDDISRYKSCHQYNHSFGSFLRLLRWAHHLFLQAARYYRPFNSNQSKRRVQTKLGAKIQSCSSLVLTEIPATKSLGRNFFSTVWWNKSCRYLKKCCKWNDIFRMLNRKV